MPFGVPAVVSSTVCMIPYAAQFVNKYFSLFSCIRWLPDPVQSSFPNFSASLSLLYFSYQCFFELLIIFQLAKKKKVVYCFSICCLTFSNAFIVFCYVFMIF
nr:MAG TPA: hypothetical protein [Caudoviricetes sp.]